MRRERKKTGSRSYSVTRVPEAEIKVFPRGLSKPAPAVSSFPTSPGGMEGRKHGVKGDVENTYCSGAEKGVLCG